MKPHNIIQSPIYQLECLNIVEEIIDGLDEKGIKELISGTGGDINSVFDDLMRDTYDVIFTGKTDIDFAPKYTERLSQTLEEILRCKSITYFITSVMPEFQLSWHHLEWGDLIARHKKLCIEAARDHGKCLATNTEVLMFDGRVKRADEIKVGDLLMGIDSTPRKVIAINNGYDEHMYRIKQSNGDDYIVNSKHINTFIHKGNKEIIDIDMPTLLSYSNNYISKNIRTFKVSWQMNEKKVTIDPYFLGFILCNKYDKKSFLVKTYNRNKETKDILKHNVIPDKYLYNSRDVRLRLLAGLIDANGNSKKFGYVFDSNNKYLTKQVMYLANSLGFFTKIKIVKNKYYHLYITGNIDNIPVKSYTEYDYKFIANELKKQYGTIDNVTPSVVSKIKLLDIGGGKFVSITTDGDHRFLLGDGTVTHNSYYFSNAYPAWQMYKYSSPNRNMFSKRPIKNSSNRGYLFSFSLQQSVDLMEILKTTIENNKILNERLFPDSRNSGVWASTNIVCKNGARLTCKGFGSSVRGAHPYWIIVDDGLKDNVIYSKIQRQKSIDYFNSVIMNMLTPGGQIIVVGTPFHQSDLYGDLKTKSIDAMGNKDRGWFVIEYPAIFPNGKILWPQRWSYEDLMEKKITQGSIIFGRENLCRPITNESSIFPQKILDMSLIRMENYTLVRNRDDFPIKFNKVVVGCDFAISSNVGADYFVFSVWGVQDETSERWLLAMFRDKGKTFHEQMQILRGINVRFRPDIMVLEQNTFQQIFVEESSKQGLPVSGHTTGIDKYDLKTGWPGLSIDFERGKIHIPIGDKYSQDMKDLIFSDLGSVAFTDHGLESVGEHDDISSSFWLAKIAANLITTGFKYTFLG